MYEFGGAVPALAATRGYSVHQFAVVNHDHPVVVPLGDVSIDAPCDRPSMA
ncbi:hypothetical protein BX257_0032 [Streptomyces sp. 3212.3]|nr:hypothetical protein BX257_0032 [Streptomyces sp. 3212.3]